MNDDLRAWLCGYVHEPLPTSQGRFDAVFVDRDGTLNVHATGYRTVEDFQLLDGAAEAIARLNRAGIPVILITNQRGLATGALTWDQLAEVHQLLVDELRLADAHLDDIWLCPHDNDACKCRKPLPGLLDAVFDENPGIERARCVMIGDTQADEGAALAAKVPFYGVTSGKTLAYVVSELVTTGFPASKSMSI